MANALTIDDVKRLLEDPSSENRSSAAEKIAHGYSGGLLSDDERRIAEDIFSVMVHDAEVRVREALASNLKSCPFLSHDIARTLAADVEAVSLPVLQFSEVLTDEDLIEIVRTHGPSKQIAVANRLKVSEVLADALVDTGNEEVVTTLVANKGAEIAEPSLQKVLDTFGENEKLSDLMAKRASLPVRVTERLVSMVTDTMRAHIIENHELEPNQVSDLVLQTREKATLGILSDKSDDMAVRELVVQLFRAGRLTPTIVLRALCMGDMRFFEAAIAVLSKVPLTNVRVLLHDDGGLGLGSILRKADIPQGLHHVIATAIEVSHETEYDGGENDRERFRRRMIERILTQVENPDMDMDDENIDYLLTKISQPTQNLAKAG